MIFCQKSSCVFLFFFIGGGGGWRGGGGGARSNQMWIHSTAVTLIHFEVVFLSKAIKITIF